MDKTIIQQAQDTNARDTPQFAELDGEQLTFIEQVRIDRAIVRRDQAEEIARALRLEGMTRDELTAVRNTVVKHLSDLASIARVCSNVISYNNYQNAMSGIVTVIDSYIYVDRCVCV